MQTNTELELHLSIIDDGDDDVDKHSNSAIVPLTNFATASFRPTDIEAMGTIFRCWVGKCAAAPDGVDGCLVIPGTRRFQIAVRIDADEKMIIGEEEDGGNLVFFVNLKIMIFWILDFG